MKRISSTSLCLLAILAGSLIFVFRKSLSFHLVSLPQIVEWVQLAQTHSEYVALFYVFFVFGVMALPITLFPIIGGVLLDYPWALVLNLVAATTGAALSFLLTKKMVRNRVHSFIKGRWKIFDYLTKQEGLKSVLVLRLLGVPPFIVTNYVLGLSSVRLQDFILGTLVGVLPWMAVVTYAAQSLWEAAVVGGEHGFRAALIKLVGPLTIVSIVILGMTVLGMRYRRKKAPHSNL